MTTTLSGRRPGRTLSALATGLGLALSLTLAGPADVATAAPEQCDTTKSPVQVTAECVDPTYARPVIDAQEDLTSPVVLHRVTGHFDGTTIRFAIYLPPAKQWQGRFFQYTYPLTDEKATDRAIEFGAASGGYTVQAGGSVALGYRHAAAAAKFAKTVAADYYGSGSRPIHGYLYGPSGGSYQTIGAAENTTGVWDGFVPMVIGTPMSAPYIFDIRAMAQVVLADKADRIADAVRPGGSGRPYAGLDKAERDMLRELTEFGVPLAGWQNPDYILGTPASTNPFVCSRSSDPAYVDAFWNRPGYLGTSESPLGKVFQAALVDSYSTVAAVEGTPPTTLTLTGVPAVSRAADLDYTVYNADKTTRIGSLSGTLDPTTGTFNVGAGNSVAVIDALVVGALVRVDNRSSLAQCSFHRHNLPAASEGYAGWDQFRDTTGEPLYPQHTPLLGPLFTQGISGNATFSGKLTGKVMIVDNLVDVDAPATGANWYAGRVKTALGKTQAAKQFRVYLNDNADHLDAPPVDGVRATYLVDWYGSVYQALRDMSAWAERGITPPASTRYRADGAIISVPDHAAARKGLQPVVQLSANGRDRVDVKVGRPVLFVANAHTAAGTGAIVSAAWDFAGTGTYTPARTGTPRNRTLVVARHTFSHPGTYFAAVKVASSRTGSRADVAAVENLDRVRVVVR